MEKLKVAICDDVATVTGTIERYLFEYVDCEFICDCFNNSSRLKETLKTVTYDIFFLDVEMPGMNGLDIAFEIRKNDFNAFIVFVTSHSNYMQEVFKVNTFDYLLKPINKIKLYQTLDRILTYTENDDSKFRYVKKNSQILISFSDIVFFEKQGRYAIVRTKHSSDKFIMSTKELLMNLNDKFVQIHTSYIINLKYLQRLDRDQVILVISKEGKNEKVKLQISRKYKSDAKNKIINFMEGKSGI